MRVISRFGLGLGFGLGAAVSRVQYLYLAALNASQTAPLTAAPTNVTQVATGAVTIPVYTGTIAEGQSLVTIAANNPAIPGAGYRDSAWYATDSAGAAIATPTVLASGLTRYDGSGLGVLAQPSFTNKVTARKYNPTDTTNVTKSGDAASVLSVVDDTAALTAAGLIGLCSLGDVYSLDNSAGSTIAVASFGGATVNTNKHSASLYTRMVAGVQVVGRIGNTHDAVLGNQATYTLGKLENKTPVGGGDLFNIYVAAGAVVYFILPSLTETTTAPPFPVVTLPTDAAAASTMAARYTSIPGTALGEKLNFVLYSNEALAAGGRDVTLFSDGTRHVKYQGAAGLLVARDESQVMGADVLGGKGTFDDAAYWTILETNPNSDVTISGGTCRLVSDGTYAGIKKTNTLVVGKSYKYSLTVTDVTTAGGGVSLSESGATSSVINTVGTHTGVFTATSTTTSVKRTSSATDITFDNLTITEVAELTYDVDLAASTQYHIGLDLGTAASMSVDGAEVATATFPAAIEWGETVYIGSKVVTGTASETLSGTLTVLQSSSDAGFDEASEL